MGWDISENLQDGVASSFFSLYVSLYHGLDLFLSILISPFGHRRHRCFRLKTIDFEITTQNTMKKPLIFLMTFFISRVPKLPPSH
jgi:hypothetical protein